MTFHLRPQEVSTAPQRSHSPARRLRLRRRLLRHHSILAALSIGSVTAIALLSSGSAAYRFSVATAYVGLFLLALTLLIGPARTLRGRKNPLSSDLRRDVGIWTALVSLGHVGSGLLVHMGGRPWLYFLKPLGGHGIAGVWPFRMDRFGFANDTGLVATLIVATLLVLSNDVAMRRLRGRRWKSLQRLNYALFGLVVVHAAGYQWLESQTAVLICLLAVCAMGVVTLQVAGFLATRARPATRVKP